METPAQSSEIEVRATPGLLSMQGPDVIEGASRVATHLAAVIESRKLYSQIGKKRHVNIEGWTTLGAMLGVFPQTVWSRRMDGEDAWEARVEVRSASGALIGAAESMCGRDEARWEKAEEYALRSMAATRAASKALRLSLGWIVELAGFAATPAEEMPHEPEPLKKTSKIDAERQKLLDLGRDLDESSRARMTEWLEENGIPPISKANTAQLKKIAEQLEALPAEMAAKPHEPTEDLF